MTLGDRTVETADYWTKEEQELDISVKQALALDKVLLSFSIYFKECMGRWPGRQLGRTLLLAETGGTSMSLYTVIEKLFFTATKLNIALHQKRMKRMQILAIWQPLIANVIRSYGRGYKKSLVVQKVTCDLMALDSNSMTYQGGSPLPHFTPLRRYSLVGSISLHRIYQDSGVSAYLSAFFSHGSCSAFSDIPRVVMHGHSLRCLS